MIILILTAASIHIGGTYNISISIIIIATIVGTCLQLLGILDHRL